MTKSTSTFTLAILFLILLSSCGSNNSCEDAALESTFTEATERITNALANVDPSDPNSCEVFKEAFEDYIDELESLQDCANDAGQGAEWREAIDEARDSIGLLTC